MSPEEARKRARAVLESQKSGLQIVTLEKDGSLARPEELHQGGKKTILHDPKGEYAE